MPLPLHCVFLSISYDIVQNGAREPFKTLRSRHPVLDETADSLQPEAKVIIHATQSAWDANIAKVSAKDATFGNVVAPLASDENGTDQPK